MVGILPSACTEWNSLVVGGHQPELFHTGVWFKNFLLAKLGEKCGAISLHVAIDHDVTRSNALNIPYVVGNECFQESVPLPIRTESISRVPWETTLTRGSIEQDWNQAIERIGRLLSSAGNNGSIIVRRSELLRQCIADCCNYGEAFSRFRHHIEIEHGLHNLEVPFSNLCALPSFGRFFLHCLQHADSLWEAYNQSREQYRLKHGIRNPAQPVPQLERSGDAIELPFWIYELNNPARVERKRLWMSSQLNTYSLCDHAESGLGTLSVILPKEETLLEEAWYNIAARGICIRPRALMTTMYLRCFVADLFIHGIGGGAYDELTDTIIKRWLGVDAPAYMVSTASLHLDFAGAAGKTSDELHESPQRVLQLMRSAPERFLDSRIESHRALFDMHCELLSSIPNRGAKFAWHQQISKVKKEIEKLISPLHRTAQLRLEEFSRSMRQDRIRRSRDFSFVLFPENEVQRKLIDLAERAFHENQG
jgi:hypothetical protein